jgi:hypothetical protein
VELELLLEGVIVGVVDVVQGVEELEVVVGVTGEIGVDEDQVVEGLDELVVEEETEGQPSLGDVALVYV